jgi:DNA-binding NtrC family response regulator
VGGTRDISVDVRILAATNRDLGEAIGEKMFREDLYYRLAVIPLRCPPLRERREDIVPLAERFIGEFARDLGKRVKGLGEDARAALLLYRWPGNVRELRNVVERAMILAPGEILTAKDLALKGAASEAAPAAGRPLAEQASLDLEQAERAFIVEALARTGGNQSRAAELLGVTRDTLRYRLKRHALE